MFRLLFQATIVLSALLGSASTAMAASYGNFTDPTGTVSYLDVRDVNGLFGAPSVSLNSLDFTPTNYQAQCSQCPTGATTADILTLDIQTISGRQIDEILISEGLDYALSSFDTAGFASAIGTANIFIDVVEINGVSVNGINSNAAISFTRTNLAGSTQSNNQSVFGFAIDNGVFTGTRAIDIQQIILGAGAIGVATRVRISLDNTLQVFHVGGGGQAQLRKRDTDFVSLTINGGLPIPEPTTAVLLMGGLAVLAGQRRRPN